MSRFDYVGSQHSLIVKGEVGIRYMMSGKFSPPDFLATRLGALAVFRLGSLLRSAQPHDGSACWCVPAAGSRTNRQPHAEFWPQMAVGEGSIRPSVPSRDGTATRFGEPGLLRFLSGRDHVEPRSPEPPEDLDAAWLVPQFEPCSTHDRVGRRAPCKSARIAAAPRSQEASAGLREPVPAHRAEAPDIGNPLPTLPAGPRCDH